MNILFAKTIEEWYLRNKRDLPWRNTNDPYLIWISEIILQQTRVAQGYDYYCRFIERFPSVSSLASASEDEVLRLWQGLGYYSRARNLHKAARQIANMNGVFPSTYDELRSLSGIGDYTTAAILSFAYNLPYSVLDGNVYRVLSRTQGIKTPIDTNAGKRLFATLAQEMLDVHNPALYNQAIMDFGALQCTPTGCDCENCPLNLMCVARAENIVGELPVKSRKVSITNRNFVYVYIHDDKYMLIRKRPKGDIWEGLYEIPLFEVESDKSMSKLPDNELLKMLSSYGGTMVCRKKNVKHQLTHQLICCDYYEMNLSHTIEDIMNSAYQSAFFDGFQLIRIEEVDKYAMPRLILKLLRS